MTAGSPQGVAVVGIRIPGGDQQGAEADHLRQRALDALRGMSARCEAAGLAGTAWTFSSISSVLDAALAGLGLAYMPEELALPHIEGGRRQAVLKDWSPTFSGLPILFARRQSPPALSPAIEALRHRRQLCHTAGHDDAARSWVSGDPLRDRA